MIVRYDGDQEVAVPGIPVLWTSGLQQEVSEDDGARLLRNRWFSHVLPAPPPVDSGEFLPPIDSAFDVPPQEDQP